MNSTFNHRDLPVVNELILIAIRKGIQEKLVYPGVTRFPLVWPPFWWPPEIRPKASKSPTAVSRKERTTSSATAAEVMTDAFRRLKGKSKVRTKAYDLSFSEWKPVLSAAEVDSFLLRTRSFSISDLRGLTDQGRFTHPAIRKRSLSLHDDELKGSSLIVVKNKKGLLWKMRKIGNIIKKSIRSSKKNTSEGISRENSSHSQSSDLNSSYKLSTRVSESILHFDESVHSSTDSSAGMKSGESLTVKKQDKSKYVLSRVLKIGKKITKALHDSHQHISPQVSMSSLADVLASPSKVSQSTSGPVPEGVVEAHQREGYLMLEATRKSSETDLTIELRDSKGKFAGAITLTLNALHWRSDGGSRQRLTLCLSKIIARGLKTVDIRGTNDPYLEVSLGQIWNMRTTVIHDGGSDVEWRFEMDNMSTRFSVTHEDLRLHELKIVARDYNKFMSHVLIGEGRFPLTNLNMMITADSTRNASDSLVYVVLKAQQLYLYGKKSESREEQAPFFVADLDGALCRHSSKRPTFEIKHLTFKGERATLTFWAGRQTEAMEWVNSLTNSTKR